METVTLKMDFGDLGQAEVEVTFKRIPGEPALYHKGFKLSPDFADTFEVALLTYIPSIGGKFYPLTNEYAKNKTFQESVDDALQSELDRQALEEAPE